MRLSCQDSVCALYFAISKLHFYYFKGKMQILYICYCEVPPALFLKHLADITDMNMNICWISLDE